MSWKVPIGHSIQTPANSFSWKRPKGHSLHVTDPKTSAYLPGRHAGHIFWVSLSFALPMPHFEHASSEPAKDQYPIGQFSQLVDGVPHLPAGHLEHVTAVTEP